MIIADLYANNLESFARSHLYSPASIVEMTTAPLYGGESTFLSSTDERVTSLIFRAGDIVNLNDLLKEKAAFEDKYELTSNEFYSAWKNGASFRSKDFERWSKICQRLSYAGAL